MNKNFEQRLWRIACVVITALYLLSVPSRWQCEGVDELEYLGVAHSLAHGEGYRLEGAPYTYYPPVVPVMWSLVMRLNPDGWDWMYRMNAALGVVAFLLAACWFRKDFGREGRIAGWLMAGSYYAWSFSTRYLMSEPAFLLFSMLAVYFAWRGLSSESRSYRWIIGVAACVLLSAMTRSGAIALTAGLTLAGVWHLIRGVLAKSPGRWRGLQLAVASAVAGAGFFLFWELRSVIVNPNAPESYFKWAARFMGLSVGDNGIVSRNAGEGVTEATSTWGGRLLYLARETGEYLASATRPSDNFGPMALFLFFLVAVGFIAHVRKYRTSPLAAYVSVSMVIFSLTSWVSSYSRYLFVIGPIVYLFAVEGAMALSSANPSLRFMRRIAFALFAVIGFGVTWRTGLKWAPGSADALYQCALQLLCFGFYLVLAAGALWPRAVSHIPRRDLLVVALVCACLIHSGAVAWQRWKLVKADFSLHEKNMMGVFECGQWISRNTAADSRIMSSLPRMAVILADRAALPLDEGTFEAFDGYALLSGNLRYVPAFQPEVEERLHETSKRAGWETIYSSGDAAVMKRP